MPVDTLHHTLTAGQLPTSHKGAQNLDADPQTPRLGSSPTPRPGPAHVGSLLPCIRTLCHFLFKSPLAPCQASGPFLLGLTPDDCYRPWRSLHQPFPCSLCHPNFLCTELPKAPRHSETWQALLSALLAPASSLQPHCAPCPSVLCRFHSPAASGALPLPFPLSQCPPSPPHFLPSPLRWP